MGNGEDTYKGGSNDKSIVAKAMEKIRGMFEKRPTWDEACPFIAIGIDHLDQEITKQRVQTNKKLDLIHTDVKRNGGKKQGIEWASPLGPVRFPTAMDCIKVSIAVTICGAVFQGSCQNSTDTHTVTATLAAQGEAIVEQGKMFEGIVLQADQDRRTRDNQYHAMHGARNGAHCAVCTEEGHPH